LKKSILKIAKKIGMDGAILFTSSSRLIQVIGGIVSILMIAMFLTDVEQGFYYTFSSILAIQVFFELGLNGIIIQYVAHEVSHLTQDGEQYEGSEKHLSRMASLLRFAVKWYSVLAIFVFFLLLIVGFVFFNHFYKSDLYVDWHSPWIVLSLGTALNFVVSPIIAFIEGLGKVKETAKIRLIQQLIVMAVIYLGLASGLKLYVGGISSILGVLVLFFYIYKKFFPLLRNIYYQEINERVSYRMEIFSFQWKIALSWVGGYFISQLFNPVLFATEGAVVAGQMGMSLSIINAILALSFAWMSTKIPIFSGYIAQRDFLNLDRLFNTTFWQSTYVNLLATMGALIMIYGLQQSELTIQGKNIGHKFLSFYPLLFMMISFSMNHIIGSLAVYLRCHKKEPMLIHSLVFAALSFFSTIVLGSYYGVIGITAGYCLITLGMALWANNIFLNMKKKWHKNEI